jgi:hypothetical protein
MDTIERSTKLLSVLSGLLEYRPVGLRIERLIQNFKVMFASQEELSHLFAEARDLSITVLRE